MAEPGRAGSASTGEAGPLDFSCAAWPGATLVGAGEHSTVQIQVEQHVVAAVGHERWSQSSAVQNANILEYPYPDTQAPHSQLNVRLMRPNTKASMVTFVQNGMARNPKA